MKDTLVARRYAMALFQVARKDASMDTVWADLLAIERELERLPALRTVLLHQLATEERKIHFAELAFGDSVSAASLGFLKLLIRKKRETMLDLCIAEFRTLVEELNNIVDATAISAAPLTGEQSGNLVEALKKMTGKYVHLTHEIDKSILGGVIVRIGDNIIDGSLRGRLRRLQKQMLSATQTGRG